MWECKGAKVSPRLRHICYVYPGGTALWLLLELILVVEHCRNLVPSHFVLSVCTRDKKSKFDAALCCWNVLLAHYDPAYLHQLHFFCSIIGGSCKLQCCLYLAIMFACECASVWCVAPMGYPQFQLIYFDNSSAWKELYFVVASDVIWHPRWPHCPVFAIALVSPVCHRCQLVPSDRHSKKPCVSVTSLHPAAVPVTAVLWSAHSRPGFSLWLVSLDVISMLTRMDLSWYCEMRFGCQLLCRQNIACSKYLYW